MKVILDEGVPRQVARHLPAHHVKTVPDLGWASAKNGVLLGLMEQFGCDVFVTCDKNLAHQQHQLGRRPFGTLVLSTNHWPSMQPHIVSIAEAVDFCVPGTVTQVKCGHFVPHKFRSSTS